MITDRIAIMHDWLIGMRGGEKCLEYLCRVWPKARLHTLLAYPPKLSPLLRSRLVQTSLLQWLPKVERYHRYLLPLMPAALRCMEIKDCELVFSSSTCVAKSVRPPKGIPHICYCHTPMRYAWHMRDVYMQSVPALLRPLANFILDHIREWDRKTAHRVTLFIANSENIRRRIREAYDRDSLVVHPPVDVDFYHPMKVEREEYYLVVSALVPYKRVDLAIEACARLGRPLLIIGKGDAEASLRAHAKGQVTFAGWQANEQIRLHLQRCRALLFPGEEDFGIVPLEAQACGTPVIALGRGGALETILPWGASTQPTGFFFNEQNVDSLADAMLAFEKHLGDFAAEPCRRQAERFSIPRFQRQMSAIVKDAMRNSDFVGQQRKAA